MAGVAIAVVLGVGGWFFLRWLWHVPEPAREACPPEAPVSRIRMTHSERTLARIASSRSAPDHQRARAIRTIAARSEREVVGSVLRWASRACGRATCIEILRCADAFPDPESLERTALTLLRESEDEELRRAAQRALQIVRGRAGPGAVSLDAPGGAVSIKGN